MVLTLAYFIVPNVQAQPFFNAPLTPDFGLGNVQNNVLNTGTENGLRFNGSTFDQVQVVVWDGASPGWNFIEENVLGSPNISGPHAIGDPGRGIHAEDPDIVFDHSTGTQVLIVYHANVSGLSNVYLEVWDVSGTPFRTIGPVFASNGRTGFEHHANIDIGLTGKIAVVWQDDSNGPRDVVVRAFEMTPTLLGTVNETRLSNLSLGYDEFYEPDVSLNDPEDDPVVHLAFNALASGLSEIYTNSHGLSWVGIFTGGYGPYYTNLWQTYNASGGFTLHPPRISDGYEHIFDHAITFGAYAITEFYIELGVRYANIVTTNTFAAVNPINSFPVSLVNQPNLRPAISFVGDIIMVAWTYDDATLGLVRGEEEVLVKQYFPDGTPLTSTLDYYAYLIDQNIRGGNTVSVAGRYNSRGSYFAWHDVAGPQVLFKNADWQTLNLRQGRPENQLAAQIEQRALAPAYPNPFTDHLRVADLGEPIAMHITLHDVLGRLQCQQTFGIFEEKVIDTNTLKAGMYTLTITTSHGKEQHKVVKR